jgi:hypothetical protein
MANGLIHKLRADGEGNIHTCPVTDTFTFFRNECSARLGAVLDQTGPFNVVPGCLDKTGMIGVCFDTNGSLATNVRLLSECAENLVEEDEGHERAVSSAAGSGDVVAGITEIVTITEVTEVTVVEAAESEDTPADSPEQPSETDK